MNGTRSGLEAGITDQILVALRRIVRAIDRHSKYLAQEYGLTGPQVVLLKELASHEAIHPSELARRVSLSHATVTDILNRLEKRGLVTRARSLEDRRRILVRPTRRGIALVERSPPLLQEQFSRRLTDLQDWELAQILCVLQRMASMMDAKQIDAAPVLATGSVTADPETVEMVTRSKDKQPKAPHDPDREAANRDALVKELPENPSAA